MECPEAVERGQNFRLLKNEELPELLDYLTQYLPVSLKFQQTLLTYMRHRVWEFHFYVANDWPEVPVCLHFPGMTLAPHGLLYESVGVFCPLDQLHLLGIMQNEDILIDWSRPLYINFVHSDIADKLTQLYEGAGTVERVLGDVWACEEPEKTEQIEDEPVDLEEEVQVLPLKAEHAECIHELYPANDMECHELFLRLIRILPAAGVFVNGKLAAWMVQSYYGAMFSMQTKPEYRRKGYGIRLARYLTKLVADRGYNPFVVIRPENEASQSLYKKLGFRKLYQMVRMTFIPDTWQEMEDEANSILRDNLENAVRQLNIEQRIINAFQDDQETILIEPVDEAENTVLETSDLPVEIEGVIEEPEDQSRTERTEENPVEDEAEVVVEELEDPEDDEYNYVRDDEVLESIAEQSEERRDSTEESQESSSVQNEETATEA
ncbi:uncharacterized protein LOC117175219 [Belonocnema kinseyi]|uniref:uncharacterized protein LOC117175219 n=1 Tax=Belonocnema kinseyi TaxID=2817044 RepID=UPI00143D438B|nr:uncharacterized protein LOC117175219 [Belonocnema kinseyi]XP_033220766.1 uncharacterized protein LOC117175219 [Belonocnema kinseyi]XP_033220767.1 uncharacterized protein LOC117175219 [Belonocnema kinseyi]